MQFRATSAAPLEFETPCLMIPIWGKTVSGLAQELDTAVGGLVTEIVEQDGFAGAPGTTRVLYLNGVEGSSKPAAAARVMLIGVGKLEKLTLASWRTTCARAARAARDLKRSEFALVAPAELIEKLGARETGMAFAEGVTLGLHHVHEFKTDEDTKGQTWITDPTLLVPEGQATAVEAGVEEGEKGAKANLRTRSWVNLPSNMKSPQLMVEQASQICARGNLKGEFWDEKRLVEERMGALYAVGMGSDNQARFIIMDYAPAGTESDQPVVLVGKGVTFDSGGYSIKPARGMEDMKDDMAGSAVVLGVMSALTDLNYPKRVIGLIPTAENMISGNAQRPGDIVTARNGKTIEVLNTDAEGRLILADALAYASELNPRLIVDYATLTGAIGVALGSEAAGLFATDDELSKALMAAGEATGERLWPFPMWDEYKEHVKGTITDVKNIGSEGRAGSIAGAIFLEAFVGEDIPWAHLDIAAVSFLREDRPLSKRGATGFGVRLTLEFLRALQ